MSGAGHDLNLIAAYVEGRLSPADTARVTAHLASCDECRAILAGFLRADRSGLEIPHERPAIWRRTAVWLPLAASVIIAVGASMLYLRREAIQPRPTIDVTTTAPPAGRGTTPSAPIPPASGTAPGVGQGTTRAAGERAIGGKTFRLVAGEWVDTTYDPFALLDMVTVRTPEDRDRVLQNVAELRPYTALGSRFTVVYGRTVYKFDLPR